MAVSLKSKFVVWQNVALVYCFHMNGTIHVLYLVTNSFTQSVNYTTGAKCWKLICHNFLKLTYFEVSLISLLWVVYFTLKMKIQSKSVIAIVMTSNECSGVSNYQKFDCLFNILLSLTSRKTPKPGLLALWEGNPPVTNGPVTRKTLNFTTSSCCVGSSGLQTISRPLLSMHHIVRKSFHSILETLYVNWSLINSSIVNKKIRY